VKNKVTHTNSGKQKDEKDLEASGPVERELDNLILDVGGQIRDKLQKGAAENMEEV
jgi:hypothetical protein